MKETNFIRVKFEAVLGFSEGAYVPTEFSDPARVMGALIRELGMFDRPNPPVWVQNSKSSISMFFPNKNHNVPTEKELKECLNKILEEWTEEKKRKESSGAGASTKTKASAAPSPPKKKRSKRPAKKSGRNRTST